MTHSYKFESSEPHGSFDGGTFYRASKQKFPALRGLAIQALHLKAGSVREPHSHPNCDEFLFIVLGHGTIYTDEGEEPAGADDVIFTPAGLVHGFNNTSSEDVLLLWGWSGAGSLSAAGYELHDHR